MSSDPEVIRAQIAATRADLSNNVNELESKVSPAQIAQRQRDKLRQTASSVKDHIMGSSDHATSAAGSALSSVGTAVSDAPGKLVGQAKGSPVGAGLIAFGVGVLLSALLPASKPEAQAAAKIKESAQPLVEQATSAAKEVAGNLQEPAQGALESVKSTATDAVSTVKDEGTSAASDVKDQAQDAKSAVQEQAGS